MYHDERRPRLPEALADSSGEAACRRRRYRRFGAGVREAETVLRMQAGIHRLPLGREPGSDAPGHRTRDTPWRSGQYESNGVAAPSVMATTSKGASCTPPMPGEPAGIPGRAIPSMLGFSARSLSTASSGTWPSTK